MGTYSIDTEFGTISCEVSDGTGPAIIFIHGNSSSAKTWQQQLASELGSMYRCIAIDLPGHGGSARLASDENYNLATYAGVVAAVAQALTGSPPVLVGWSLGGHVALEALTVIDSVPGVLIFGTPPIGKPPSMETAFFPNPAMGVGFTPEVTAEDAAAYATSFLAPDSSMPIDDYVADILATDGNARAGVGASLGVLNYTDELELVANMTQPLAIVHGVAEQLVVRDYFNDVEAPTLWRDSVQEIAGAGHAPQHEAVAEFNALIMDFMASL